MASVVTPPGPPHRAVQVPGYAVLALLCRGAIGDVYLARRQPLERRGAPVVLKRLRTELEADSQFVELFTQEQGLARLIQHPNVVEILDVVQAPGCHALAMEFLDGRNLLQMACACRAQGAFIPLHLLAHVMAETLAALEHAHTLRGPDGRPLEMVHRDVSPDNVVVTYDGRVKLVDFGVARVAGSRSDTRPGQLTGKVVYTAPEVLHGSGVDRRADIFSAGVTLYECMTHVSPFWGGNAWELANAIATQSPVPPRSINPAVSAELEHICLRALEKDPARRFQTAAEMRSALMQLVVASGRRVGQRHVAALMESLFPPARDRVRQRVTGLLRATLPGRVLEADAATGGGVLSDATIRPEGMDAPASNVARTQLLPRPDLTAEESAFLDGSGATKPDLVLSGARPGTHGDEVQTRSGAAPTRQLHPRELREALKRLQEAPTPVLPPAEGNIPTVQLSVAEVRAGLDADDFSPAPTRRIHETELALALRHARKPDALIHDESTLELPEPTVRLSSEELDAVRNPRGPVPMALEDLVHTGEREALMAPEARAAREEAAQEVGQALREARQDAQRAGLEAISARLPRASSRIIPAAEVVDYQESDVRWWTGDALEEHLFDDVGAAGSAPIEGARPLTTGAISAVPGRNAAQVYVPPSLRGAELATSTEPVRRPARAVPPRRSNVPYVVLALLIAAGVLAALILIR
ncbi:MAG: serine/threonine-protein kinase [Myxococcota bacterium]